MTPFPQAVSSGCTINGQPASCSQVSHILVPILLFVFIPLFVILIVLAIFWVKSLMHVVKHQDVPNRTLWIILHFVGLGILCGVVYLIFVKRPYDKQHVNGAAGIPPQQPTPEPPPPSMPINPGIPT